ncbi:DUF4245 domain-containing protein [Rathayibacter toxicus]|uniref:DUF4245 domain-containing protein n=1 Tax=Rathayibacter toxicus TaxID=145458 RepID=A0A2S5Y697_9MICO|nr:DUF4245 domain-containing protein [Rathayibacter toxicus]PPH22674.1 DUF4245 domain-containing protein [Rathayibacter toxicus]PPH56877.1 DUF4245 domain-containing protein [Rathayibacter toxicus]PPH59568.1 DUF4245 domain-containing protein [Rathayibacter toxicus]PPH86798.1 DUF4245 domain-containing protein [Rathayibacter toxicus]PPI14517.1 DUF4245 domain-containing protein [Rathayibacter toxicus]
MSRSKQPRIVAELGRPETADETAARKAENSRLYRQRKTVNNLIFSLLATVGAVALIVLLVPRGEGAGRPAVDASLVASQLQLGRAQRLAVPPLPEGWSANAAEVRQADGIDYWYVGLLTAKAGYIGVSQGLDADNAWVASQLSRAAATGAEQLNGHEWTVYDRRASGAAAGNTPYALATRAGSSTYLVYGTAPTDEIHQIVSAITPQLGQEESR